MPRKAKPLTTEGETYDCALNLLSFRDHSCKELRQKLTRRGANVEQVDSSLAKLEDYGIINDERYGQRVYEAWLGKKIYGRQHLVAELHKKGVPQEYISMILEQFTDELEQARAEMAADQFCRLQKRKIEQYLQSSDPKEKQRFYAAAARYMLSRGFSGEYVELIINKVQK